MLPKDNVPIYELLLPSASKNIEIRPFLVKEEKIMLIAAQSKDAIEIKNSIKQILTNCILTPNINVEELPQYDVEWILINLRMRSVGNKIENEYVCNNTIPGANNTTEVCNTPFKVAVNLEEIKLATDKPKNEIWFNDNLGVLMRQPRFNYVPKGTGNYDFDLLKETVVAVFDTKQQYPLKEQTDMEINEFFDGLTKEKFQKIIDWLAGIPQFVINKEHTCEKCGFVHKVVVDDLASFF